MANLKTVHRAGFLPVSLRHVGCILDAVYDSGIAFLVWSHDTTLSACVALFNSAAATLTSPGLICLGERAVFNCTIMENILGWLYSDEQVGPPLDSTTSTPDTTAVTVNNIVFTVTHISNGNGVLVSGLSFIAVIATRGHIITCFRGGSRDDATIEFGSGKDNQLCICSST